MSQHFILIRCTSGAHVSNNYYTGKLSVQLGYSKFLQRLTTIFGGPDSAVYICFSYPILAVHYLTQKNLKVQYGLKVWFKVTILHLLCPVVKR